jgi:putative two-component system response regulator
VRVQLASHTAGQATGTAIRGTILVVDDEPEICAFVRSFLEWVGFGVDTAGSPDGARERLTERSYDLVITDLCLGEASGLDLIAEIRRTAPGTRVILISAHADAQAASRAMDEGVDALLLKPFEPRELRERVEQAFARRSAARAAELERRSLQDRLRVQEEQAEKWKSRAVHALTSAVEAKDKYTAGHASRVAAYALTIAREIGGIDLGRFEVACGLHDVGKIGVPDAVLNRPAQLTEEEFQLVVAHPDTGERILQTLIDDPEILGTVRWHHERWDGRGYPDGRAGDDIPLPARVLAVADTIDAMTSHRAYRTGLPFSVAVAEVRRCAGTQFDPRVVGAFERVLDRLETLYLAFTVERSHAPN